MEEIVDVRVTQNGHAGEDHTQHRNEKTRRVSEKPSIRRNTGTRLRSEWAETTAAYCCEDRRAKGLAGAW